VDPVWWAGRAGGEPGTGKTGRAIAGCGGWHDRCAGEREKGANGPGAGLYRSVAVPLDGTPEAESAVELAAAIATHWKASLNLLMTARAGAGVASGRLRGAAASSGYLEALRSRLVTQTGVRARALVLGGDAAIAERLVTHVRAHAVDLLVTTPWTGGFDGAPAARLCEWMPAAVLVVPERHPAARRPGNILVTLDGTQSAEGILGFVTPLAKMLSGQLTLLTILAPSYVIGASGSRGAQIDCRVGPKRRMARSYLDGVAERLRAEGHEVATRVQVRGRAAGAIADFAMSEGFDLLAMSGSGRGSRNVVLPEVLRLLEGTTVATLTHQPRESRLSRRLRPVEG
jgi:nucleotide-binding universal stress UspA family protein